MFSKFCSRGFSCRLKRAEHIVSMFYSICCWGLALGITEIFCLKYHKSSFKKYARWGSQEATTKTRASTFSPSLSVSGSTIQSPCKPSRLCACGFLKKSFIFPSTQACLAIMVIGHQCSHQVASLNIDTYWQRKIRLFCDPPPPKYGCDPLVGQGHAVWEPLLVCSAVSQRIQNNSWTKCWYHNLWWRQVEITRVPWCLLVSAGKLGLTLSSNQPNGSSSVNFSLTYIIFY